MPDAPLRTTILLNYGPRVWAKRLHASWNRWACLVLHRRAGKTTGIINHHLRAALNNQWERERLRRLLPAATEENLARLLKSRVYWHVMPTYKQAKTVAWAMLKDAADPVPGRNFNESELLVKLPNGNQIQLIGGDSPDSLRGPALSGLSMDEYSQIPAEAFSEVLSKALADHLGYCIFSGTIKGTDQLYAMYHDVKNNPEWFSLWQNVDVSLATETGATIQALERAMADERKLILDGVMGQDEYDQEWYLSAEAAIKGAFYKREMAEALKSGRIREVLYDPMLPVDTDWDLGIADSMTLWFSQTLRSGEVRLIDYYEASGEGFPHYIKLLREKPYVYGQHWAPHDIKVRELGTGKSRLETAAALGLKFQVTPSIPLEDGIAAVRLFLAKCWFDQQKTAVGLNALRNYRKSFNERLQEFTGTPIHDVHSHGADAFRGLAVRHKVPREKGRYPLPQLPSGADGWLGA